MKGNDRPMVNFLSKVLWRTAKKDVLDQVIEYYLSVYFEIMLFCLLQINIPKQTFKEHILEFSAVEKYFYKREHELSSSDFLFKARKFDSSLILEKLDRRILKQVSGYRGNRPSVNTYDSFK